MSANGTVELTETEALQRQLKMRELQVGQLSDTVELFQERLAELELALEDTGWLRFATGQDYEFSRAGLKKMMRLARFSYLKNPLIRNAVEVQKHYVWGQGVHIASQIDPVDELIQAFMNDKNNARELFSHVARMGREVQLTVEGNLFFVLFANVSTGFVRVKSVKVDQITQIICNPENEHEPWFYQRTWTPAQAADWSDLPANNEAREKNVLYPDYRLISEGDYSSVPSPRPTKFQGMDIAWDQPMYHVKVGGLPDMRFGVPEIYAALDWARAVKEDLEDYATVKRALARFAWNLVVKGGKAAVTSAKTKLSTTMAVDDQDFKELNPPAVTGSTFIGAKEAAELQPMRTAGSQPSPDEGRRLWLMAAAGSGIPEVMLAEDADVGNYATSKSLDRPTELKMRDRQTLWADVIRDLIDYCIDSTVKAPSGKLPGKVVEDPYTGEEKVLLADDPETGEEMSREIEVTFPAILQKDVLPHVQAIVQAATLNGQASAGTIDDRTVAKLLLGALGEDEINDMLDELFPENYTTDLGKDNQLQPVMLPSGLPPQPGSLGPQPVAPAPTQESIALALREFRESIEAVLGRVELLDGEEDELDEKSVAGHPHPHRGHPGSHRGAGHAALVAHLRTHHPGVATTGKSHRQLRTAHGSSHAHNAHVGHTHATSTGTAPLSAPVRS